MTKKEKRMLTSLDVKAAIATEGTVAILGTACRLGKKAVSDRQQVATARRRSHALD
jgi:UDP-N-acetylmuramyl pentapeptide synthase